MSTEPAGIPLPNNVEDVVAPGDQSEIRSRTGMGRLGVGLALGAAAFVLPLTAAAIVLLPVKIATIDPGNKIALYAILSAVGSLVAIVTNIIFGAVSDRTRSRLGRRNPWVLIGAVAGGVCLILLGTANSYGTLMLYWCLYEATLSAIGISLAAVVPDRVPHIRRGTISAVYGSGLLVWGAFGAVIGSKFVTNTAVGFDIVAGLAVILAVGFVLLAPDFSNTGQPRQKFVRADLIKTFAFPRKAPDFYWALAARLLIILGYYVVGGFELYILTGYMKLSSASAAGVISSASLLGLVGSLAGALISAPISDRLHRRKAIVVIAAILIGLGAITPFVFPHPWAIVVFAIVAGFGFGIYFSVDAALMSEVLPSEATRGKDLGILNMAGAGGQILAPVISAAVVGVGIGYAPLFLVSLLFCVLSGAAILPIKRVR